MTTFQAVVYAIVRGFTEFLPVSWDAHATLIPSLFSQWPAPQGAFTGALALSSLLALLVYFRHDWASLISCFLQVLLFRRKPMTLDERMPFFIIIATLPVLIFAPYFRDQAIFGVIRQSPLWTLVALAGFGLPLWFSDSMSRKTKGMFDWNWLDALFVGVFQLATLVVGLGALAATLIVAFFRNYSRESAAKFALYILVPLLGAQAIQGLREPLGEISKLSLGAASVVCFFASLLAIGAFMKHVLRQGMAQYFGYRILVAAAAAGYLYFSGIGFGG